VKTEYRVLNTTKVPGSNNVVAEVEVILGDGLEALNSAAKAQNTPPVAPRVTIRITIDGNGAFVAAESAAGEKSPMVEFLARKAFENAPRTPGVSPWIKGIGWAGLVLFIGITVYRYSRQHLKINQGGSGR
jgi:hypothetical protein